MYTNNEEDSKRNITLEELELILNPLKNEDLSGLPIDEDFVQTSEDYVNRISKIVEKKGLEKNIEVEKVNLASFFVKERDFSYPIRTRVTVKNLNISTRGNKKGFRFNAFNYAQESKEDEFHRSFFLRFEKNIFSINSNTLDEIIFFGSDCFFYFKDNEFYNSVVNFKGEGEISFLYLDNNTFHGECVLSIDYCKFFNDGILSKKHNTGEKFRSELNEVLERLKKCYKKDKNFSKELEKKFNDLKIKKEVSNQKNIFLLDILNMIEIEVYNFLFKGKKDNQKPILMKITEIPVEIGIRFKYFKENHKKSHKEPNLFKTFSFQDVSTFLNRVKGYHYWYSNKLGLTPKNIYNISEQKHLIKLTKNTIKNLNINCNNLVLGSKNVIEKFNFERVSSSYNFFQLSPQNIFDQDGKNSSFHKDLFIKLRKKTKQDEDKVQYLTFTREITKCDEILIKKENFGSRQDRLIFEWGGFISNYGISFVRPLGFIICLNIVSSIIIICLNHPTNLKIFFEMLFKSFNILSLDFTFLDLQNKRDYIVGITYLIILFQKIFYSLLIYELIKVFRRFK